MSSIGDDNNIKLPENGQTKNSNYYISIIVILGILTVVLTVVTVYILVYPDPGTVYNKFTFEHATFMHKSLKRTLRILKHGKIKYSLYGGSLLAWRRTINNGPFVWDDDLDLVVPKTDWCQLVDLLEKQADDFGLEFQHVFFGLQLRAKDRCGDDVLKNWVLDIFVLEWVNQKARKVDIGGLPDHWKAIRYSPALTTQRIFPERPRLEDFWGLQASVPADDEAVDIFLQDHYGPSCLTHARLYNHNGLNTYQDINLANCPGLNIGMPVPAKK